MSGCWQSCIVAHWLLINGKDSIVCFVQEISDDLGRHRSDAQVNNADVTVLRGREEVISQWKHLQPGDLVKVCCFCPACLKHIWPDLCFIQGLGQKTSF